MSSISFDTLLNSFIGWIFGMTIVSHLFCGSNTLRPKYTWKVWLAKIKISLYLYLEVLSTITTRFLLTTTPLPALSNYTHLNTYTLLPARFQNFSYFTIIVKIDILLIVFNNKDHSTHHYQPIYFTLIKNNDIKI